jgi:para-aminobenzoate synthetase component 1
LPSRGNNQAVLTEPLPWISPLDAAGALKKGESCWALLYSGQRLEHTGRYSYLALYPQETVTGDDFSNLADTLGTKRPALSNAWFGMFSYELLHRTEDLQQETRRFISLPDLWFTRFGLIVCFDHDTQSVTCHRESHIKLPEWPPRPAPFLKGEKIQVTSLTSPMTREAYLALVLKTREAITRGDFYQANITRKFTGAFAAAPGPLQLFKSLCAASPAAYSACISLGGAAILSSSPERFLTIKADGHMESRPIKGTAPRMEDSAQDARARSQLSSSEKDRAENLMIVDLMRNDLARSCEPGSVKVGRLFEVSSYATLHHMASTVSGQKRKDVATLDAVRNCFPPGSMTGAPKYRAMQWCLKHEGIRRGVYSGALGWFGGDGSCDLSVVIRTLVIEGNRFEFQVGGGIVADSDPEAEWRETMTKARGILKALGVDAKVLEGI